MTLLRDLTGIFKQEDLIRTLGNKQIITARDFLLAEPTRLAPLTYQEVKALKARVARACAPFAQSGLHTYKDFVSNAAIIPSGVPQVDLLLSGGLSTGRILEIFGFSGTGKSEFCHRLAVNVSLNLRKPVLYLHTKGDFDAQLIVEVMQGLSPVPPSSQAIEDATKKIQVAHISSMEHLLVALPNLLLKTNPRVVIVDSMTALVHPHLDAQMATLAKLQTVANGLKRAAAESQFALLLVNHRTEVATDATEDEAEQRAAMGTAWQSVPQTRLLFAKKDGIFSVSVVKDAYLPKKEKIKRLREYGSLNLPSNASRPTIRCQYCFNSWHEQLYKVRVKPKRRVSSASSKILKRYEQNPNQLRPIEKKLVKKLQKTSNSMVMTCSVCQKTTTLEMAQTAKPAPLIPSDQEPESAKKKRKRKKDKLCGLKMSLSGTGSDLLCRTPISSAASSPLTMSPCPSPLPVKIPKILMASTPKAKSNLASAPNNSKSKIASELPSKSKKKKGKPEKKSNKSLLQQKLNRETKNSLRDFLTSIP